MISKLFTWLCVRWFRYNGWVIAKQIPKSTKKYVLAVAPHTSNVDFFVGVAARHVMKINTKYVAKKELFRFPVRKLMLNLGGFPIDRSKRNSFVEQMSEYFDQKDEFSICVTPEGTRGRVTTWKTGFYHIALTAKIPIVMMGFDYERKWILTSDPFMPSGNIEEDIAMMHKFYGKVIPKCPENWFYQQKNEAVNASNQTV